MDLSRVLMMAAAVVGAGFCVAYSWTRISPEEQGSVPQANDAPVATKSLSTVAANAIASIGGGSSGKSVDEITDLREEVAALRAEVSSLRRHMPTQTQAQADTQALSAEKNLRTDAMARAEAEKNYKKQMATIETAFRNESNDPKWSPRAASMVQ